MASLRWRPLRGDKSSRLYGISIQFFIQCWIEENCWMDVDSVMDSFVDSGGCWGVAHFASLRCEVQHCQWNHPNFDGKTGCSLRSHTLAEKLRENSYRKECGGNNLFRWTNNSCEWNLDDSQVNCLKWWPRVTPFIYGRLCRRCFAD